MEQIRRWVHIGFITALMGMLAGCGSSQSATTWNGPVTMSSVSVEDAADTSPPIKLIHTSHYKIYSTIQDRPEFLDHMGQLMEGAFSTYRTLAPDVAPTEYPMQVYMFATRPQWADFTRQHTGQDADIYLKISRGGYTIHDWSVLYFLGDIGTYSVAAHEGWHQFVNRHFIGRLPPFLEEGLACMFEGVEWSGGLPRWNLSSNPARTLSLRRATDARALFPLDHLIILHAGEVVAQPNVKIEAFYSQNWAFARYLWEGENGKYRRALQAMLDDTAKGTVYDPTGSHHRSYSPWNPAGVRPMLEHYLGEDLSVTEAGFIRFEHDIAFEQLARQFE